MTSGNPLFNLATAAGNLATGNLPGAVLNGAQGVYNLFNGAQNAAVKQGDINATRRAQEIKSHLDEQFRTGALNPDQYHQALRQLSNSVDNLNQGQRDYQTDANSYAGNAGNSLANGVLNNALNRQQAQDQGTDQLALATAATPLAQYQNDADLKRKMALQNQQNLANNVTTQLNNLNQARATNANMIQSALAGGRQQISM